MSAPDTNPNDEEKKHGPSLLGIRASLCYGVGLLAIFTIYVITASNEPEVGAVGEAAGSSMIDGDTEASALEGYEAGGYEPGGNSTGSVQTDGQ